MTIDETNTDSGDSEGRKRVAVLFGGRSVEHEISVITALQLMKALDTTRYTICPVYVAPSGKWYTGAKLFDRQFYKNLQSGLSSLMEVTLLPRPGDNGLTVLKAADNSFHLSTSRLDVVPVDIFFLAFHGEFGEDGCIQGVLEMADVTYTGPGVLSSSLAMNKQLCKNVLHDSGIAVLPGGIVRKFDAIRDLAGEKKRIRQIPGLEQFPLFVKPCHLGSSIGVGRALDDSSFDAALANVFRHDNEALVEPFLADMFEINCSVLNGIASAVEIPVASAGVLSYEDKYLRDGGKKSGRGSQGMASLTRVINPKDLDRQIQSAVQQTAEQAYSILDCEGVVRFDFMFEKKTGILYFNELNPLPGSLSFYLWAESTPQLLYTEVLNRIIERAEERRMERASLSKNIGFRAL